MTRSCQILTCHGMVHVNECVVNLIGWAAEGVNSKYSLGFRIFRGPVKNYVTRNLKI